MPDVRPCRRPAPAAPLRALALLAAFAAASVACGKKGPPLAPLVHVPVPPADFTARRIGNAVHLQLSIPQVNTDGTRPADISSVTVYGFTGTPVSNDDFIKRGMVVAQFPVRIPPPPLPEGANVPPLPPIGTGLDQGALAVAIEELTPAVEQPILPKAPRRPPPPPPEPSEVVLALPLGGPPPDVPLARMYTAIGTNRRGRKGPFSARVSVPLLQPPSRPPAPTVTYSAGAIAVTITPPPDARQHVQIPTAFPPPVAATPPGTYATVIPPAGPAPAPAASAPPPAATTPAPTATTAPPATTPPASAATTAPSPAVTPPAPAVTTAPPATTPPAPTATTAPSPAVTTPAPAVTTAPPPAAATAPASTPPPATPAAAAMTAPAAPPPPPVAPGLPPLAQGSSPAPAAPAAAAPAAAPGEAAPAPPAVVPSRPISLASAASTYNVYEVPPPDESAPPQDNTASKEAAAPLLKPLNPAPLATLTFTDARVEFGARRCYTVRTVNTYGTLTIESEPSPPQCVTLVDTFPPAAPKSLAAVASPGTMNLIWEANAEADLAGYIVLRAEAPGETLQPLFEAPIRETSFQDKTVKAGVTYTYSIVAVDNASPPNVSAQSNQRTETAR